MLHGTCTHGGKKRQTVGTLARPNVAVNCRDARGGERDFARAFSGGQCYSLPPVLSLRGGMRLCGLTLRMRRGYRRFEVWETCSTRFFCFYHSLLFFTS